MLPHSFCSCRGDCTHLEDVTLQTPTVPLMGLISGAAHPGGKPWRLLLSRWPGEPLHALLMKTQQKESWAGARTRQCMQWGFKEPRDLSARDLQGPPHPSVTPPQKTFLFLNLQHPAFPKDQLLSLSTMLPPSKAGSNSHENESMWSQQLDRLLNTSSVV